MKLNYKRLRYTRLRFYKLQQKPLMDKKKIHSQRKKALLLSGSSYRLGYGKGRVHGFARGLHDGIVNGRKQALGQHALIITPSICPSLEIILLQPFRELIKQGIYNCQVKQEGEVTKEAIEAADLVVFQRNVEPGSFQYIQWAHEMGKRTVYSIDDNFLAIPEIKGVSDYYCDPSRLETFANFLRNARVVQVGSPFFAEYIRNQFNPNVYVIPSSVDFAWLDQIPRPEREDGKIVIGYQGTCKEVDFAPIVPALLQILEEYGERVRLEFFGFLPATLANHPRVSVVGFDLDYRGFMKRLYQSTWDIGLAPLENLFYNHCKTSIKFLEYAACWIPGIYSASPVYTDSIAHGETGYVVPQTTEGWYSGIKHLIDDPALRSKIKEQAGAFVRQHFTIESCAAKWREHILLV